MHRLLTTGTLLLGLLACVACDPTGLDGQRVCQEVVDCAELTRLTCGDDDRCAEDDSCTAARRLASDGSDGACHSAWCDLGQSYRACP